MGAREREIDRQKRLERQREQAEGRIKRRREDDNKNGPLKGEMNPLNPFSNWSPHRPGGSPFTPW